MARPTTKDELIAAANAQFGKMMDMVGKMSDEERNAEFLFEDRDRNPRDVLIHLYEWHMMMDRWHTEGTVNKGAPAIPEDGYTWKTLPALNLEIWKKHRNTPLSEAIAMLQWSHTTIMGLIEGHTNDELFSRGVYKWTKTTTLGAYFVSSTSSHYDWAMKKIKKHLKTYRESLK